MMRNALRETSSTELRRRGGRVRPGLTSLLPRDWSHGAFRDALQRHAGHAVRCGPLVLLQRGRDSETDVRFVTSRVGQRRVVLPVANVCENEANDSADERIWAGKSKTGEMRYDSFQCGRWCVPEYFSHLLQHVVCFLEPLKEKLRWSWKSRWPLQTYRF